MTAFAQSTAKIATWNLAVRRYGTNKLAKPGKDRLGLQIEGLALLDAEVVALVEIYAKSTLDSLSTGLNDAGLSYKSIFLRQKRKPHIGVLCKAGVTTGPPQFIEGSDLGNSRRRRRALVVDMKIGKFAFHLIVVHLKSGRDADERSIRDRQCDVIGKYIASHIASKKAPRAVVLVGDFNMIPGQDVSNFHHLGGARQRSGDLQLAGQGKSNYHMDFLSSWDLQDHFSHILEKGRENLLDGFAISRTQCWQYVRGSLRLFPMHWAMRRNKRWSEVGFGLGEFRESVSDHLPFVATFRI